MKAKAIGTSLIAIIVLILSIVFYTHFSNSTDTLHNPTKYDFLYNDLGSRNHLPDLCERISPTAKLSAGWGGSGEKISLLKSECYRNLAIRYCQANYCEKVIPVSTLFLDGSKINAQTCRNQVQTSECLGNSISFGASMDGAYVKELLEELEPGYTSDPVYQESEGINEQFKTQTYWETIATTSAFIEKAKRLSY